jgi:RNA polymerase sigma factor (sigma-70 family)
MPPLNLVVENLCRFHGRELHDFLVRRVGAQQADDIAQEAYVHALQQNDIALAREPKAYLFCIAANLAIDAKRRERVRSRYAEDEGKLHVLVGNAHSSEVAIEVSVELRQLCAFLDELSPQCRNAFFLYWINDLNHSETARRLGVTVRTVQRHLLKAHEHLRRRAGQQSIP